MTTYATVAELRAKLREPYASMPEIADDDDAQDLLDEAASVIDEYSLARAQPAYDYEDGLTPTPYRDALRDATIYQVQFMLEVGPEHDVAGLKGSLVAGRLQLHPVAKTLGPRARRALQAGGLYWAGVALG